MDVAAQILDMTAPKTESPPTPTPDIKVDGASTDANPPKQDNTSPRLDVLIKREQMAVQREKIAKDKEQELQNRLSLLQAFEDAKKNKDYKKILELSEVTPEEFSRGLVDEDGHRLDVRFKQIEEKFDSFKTAQEEAEKQRLEEEKKKAEEAQGRVVKEFNSEISQYVQANKERYEHILFEQAFDLVYDTMDEYYTRTIDPETGAGKVLSIAEAADKVEEYYEKKNLERKTLRKTQMLWGGVPKKTMESLVPKAPMQPKTLTNTMSATPQARPNKPITDQEKVRMAIQNVLGQRSATL